jgi:hypothetical protein
MTLHGRTVIPGVLAVAAALGLVACGSVAVAGAGHRAAAGPATVRSSGPGTARVTARVPLCMARHRLVQLEVRLTASRPREILPRALTTTDAARVRALAAAICALPPVPPGVRCPVAPGAALLLVFADPGRGFTPVRIQDTGCASVTGAGPARQWSWSSPPGQLLSRTLGGIGRLVPGTHPSSVPMR